MKNQIDKLVNLAKEYVDYCKCMNYCDGHNTLRGDGFADKENIHIYFAENKGKQSVAFGEFEVVFYSNTIRMPIEINEERLESIYNDMLDFLNNTLKPKAEATETRKATIRQNNIERIKKLEKEIEAIKSQI